MRVRIPSGTPVERKTTMKQSDVKAEDLYRWMHREIDSLKNSNNNGRINDPWDMLVAIQDKLDQLEKLYNDSITIKKSDVPEGLVEHINSIKAICPQFIDRKEYKTAALVAKAMQECEGN